MTFEFLYLEGEDGLVRVTVRLSGGGRGRIRGAGEPTHTTTFVEAGGLTLYPEAWAELRSVLSAGVLLAPSPGDEAEIIFTKVGG